MKGFISVLATKPINPNWALGGCAHSVAIYFDKFTVDKKLDVYVKGGMGAIVGNVDVRITDIEQLRRYTDKKTKINPYQKYLDMMDQGYVLVVGRPFPAQHGGAGRNERGIYCKNYLEMAKKEEQEEIERRERIENIYKNSHTL